MPLPTEGGRTLKMKIPRCALVWMIVVGIPLMVIGCIGVVSAWVGWQWLDEKCVEWFDDIYDDPT